MSCSMPYAELYRAAMIQIHTALETIDTCNNIGRTIVLLCSPQLFIDQIN